MPLVVGIDLGTQSLKAVACDERLRVVGDHAIAHPTAYPGTDRAEQDPRAWEAALEPAIAGALRGRQGSDVAAIAIAGQLDGCVGVDARGEPVHPAMIWQDRRAAAETRRVPAARVFAIAGQVADPSHLAPKIVWLRARHAVARYHQPVSYLVERLTGEAVMDPALASTTMLFDLAARAWSQELLDGFATDARELPRIAPATQIAGTLRRTLAGIPAGTPVAVGTGDDFATPLGAGLVAPGPLVCAIGTAEVVGALSPGPVLDTSPEPMVETHVYPSGGYFVENPGWMSGGVVRWAAQLLGVTDPQLDNLAAGAPPGAGGITFIPALAGLMAPVWRPHARGTLHGLAASHDRGHIARAVLEGLAFACRDVAERLAHLGLPATEAIVLGGGSRSQIWNQLRADALGIPHRAAARTDTCALGAAMIAGVAAGWWPDLATAATLAESAGPPVSPRDNLDEPYARYRALIAQLGYAETPQADH